MHTFRKNRFLALLLHMYYISFSIVAYADVIDTGFNTNIGISQRYFIHDNKVSNVQSNLTGTFIGTTYIMESGHSIKGNLEFVIGNGYARGSSLFQGGQNLERLPLAGALSLLINADALFGYNLADMQKPVWLEFGLSVNSMLLAGTVRPLAPSFILIGVPLYLRTINRIGTNGMLEYGVGVAAYYARFILNNPLEETKVEFTQPNYALGASFDISFLYPISNSVHVYTRLFAKYYYIPKSEQKSVTNTSANMNENVGINGTSIISYPASNTFQCGLEAGIRF